MNKTPFLNAALAFLYIVSVFLLMFQLDPDHREPSIFIPIAMLSLFVLSAATMGYFFLAQPAMMYLDGKKQEAVTFFLNTLFSFAAIVGIFLVVVFFIIPAL